MKAFFILLFLIISADPLSAAGDNEARVLLDKGYEQNEVPPELMRILGSCNVADKDQGILAFSRCRTPGERSEISRLLFDLFVLSKEDEDTGRAKPVQTPYFNAPYQYPAVEFRANLLATLGSFIVAKEAQDMVLPAVQWVCENDPSAQNRGMALALLGQIQSEKADQLILGLLKPQESSAKVLVAAITLAGQRKLKQAIPVLQTFLDHPRSEVRDAGLKALEALGVQAQRAKTSSMSDPWKSALLHLFDVGLYKPSPDDRRIIIHHAGDEGFFPWYAWQLTGAENATEILNNDGSRDTLSRKEGQEKIIDSSLEEEVKALTEEIRSGKFRESYRGLPPQPLYGMAYPVFAAAWALNAGQEQQANELMQAVLSAYFDKDENAFKTAQTELAWEAYREGADAYQKGDLSKAQALFQRVADHFPEYENYKTARDLAKQLTEDIKNPPPLPAYIHWNEQTKRFDVNQGMGLDAVPALAQELKNGRYLPQVSPSEHMQDPVRYIWRVCDFAANILNGLVHPNDVIECLADKPEAEQTAQINRILAWHKGQIK